MTEAYRQGYDHGYENAKEDVLLQLMDDLNIAEECEKCPRYKRHHGTAENYRKNDLCRGHLYWLCSKFREALDDKT